MFVHAALLVLALQQPPELQRALEDLRSGRLAEAERALTAFVAREPGSADAHFYLGVLHYQAGRAAQSIPHLARATELHPKRAAAWKALGLAHAALGDMAAAEAPFRKVCDIDPANELACYYLGRNLHAQNRFDEAVRAFRRALAHERPANAWLVHRGLALALEAQAVPDEAERDFRQAIARQPAVVRPEEDAHVDYGVFLFRQGRAEDALKPLQSAAASHPGSANARFQFGRVLAQLNRLEDAARELEAAVAANPKLFAAHLLLGQVYVRSGRREDARPHLQIGSEGASAAERK